MFQVIKNASLAATIVSAVFLTPGGGTIAKRITTGTFGRVITFADSHMSRAEFNHFDANHDGVLSEADLSYLNMADAMELIRILRRIRITGGSWG